MKKYITSFIFLLFIISMHISYAEDRVSMGYIYNSIKSHTEIVGNANGNINVVSPTCFDLSNNGHLVINNIFDEEFITNMHEQGILVTPFLSNHWGRKKAMTALKNIESLTDEIIDAINEYNLDGVNIDLENLLPSSKNDLTEFVKVLRGKMPEGKILSVAVAANPQRLEKTWVAAYDYENLSKYADYLVLMAYDEHSYGGSEGPVASINFVEESIKVVLEKVSRDKLVLGMPLYGRFWKKDVDVGGEAVVIAQIDKILQRYKSVPIYDEVTKTATLVIDVKAGDKKAYINGRYLEEGSYKIYYDNKASISEKLDLMNDYGLKGAALWALDNENEDFWSWYPLAFENESYESEKQVEEKVYYEQLEILSQQIEPLNVQRMVEIININEEKTLQSIYKFNREIISENKTEYIKLLKSSNRIYEKEKNYKRLNKFSIVHLIKREMK